MDIDIFSQQNNGPNASNSRIVFILFWIVTLIVTLYIGYIIGRGSEQSANKTAVINPTPIVSAPTTVPTAIPQSTPGIVNNNICNKSGFAQQWEYLTAYIVKEGDTLQSIVESELKDKSRINEVMHINGAGQMVLDATLYLPPKSISKSSGNIKQAYGRLVEKNNSSWQLSFNGDKDGQSVVIPSFWFGEITNKDSYKVGDCLAVLFDDGYKVFTVTKQ